MLVETVKMFASRNCSALYAIDQSIRCIVLLHTKELEAKICLAHCYLHLFDLSVRLFHYEECKANKSQWPICDIVVHSYTGGFIGARRRKATVP